jgi:hypothetical protein
MIRNISYVFVQVTEIEVEEGLLNENEKYRNSQSFVILRDIQDLNDVLKTKGKSTLTQNLLKQYSQSDLYSKAHLHNLKDAILKNMNPRKVVNISV